MNLFFYKGIMAFCLSALCALSAHAMNSTEKEIEKNNNTKNDLSQQLFDAIENNDLEKMGMCINEGVDLEKPLCINKKLITPLSFAVEKNKSEAIKLLLKNNVDINKIDNSRYTPFTPLLQAVSDNQNDIAKILIEHGAHVNIIEGTDLPPLHATINPHGNTEIAEMLLKKGAYINQELQNNAFTPLMFAIRLGYIKMILFFIEQGAHVATKNSRGENAVDVAERLMRDAFPGNQGLYEGIITLLSDHHNIYITHPNALYTFNQDFDVAINYAYKQSFWL